MKKRTGKMISLSLAVAMAVTAAPVTALADENTQGSVIEASELTPVQGTGETGTDTTTVDTKEEEGTAWAELRSATTLGETPENDAKAGEVTTVEDLEQAIEDADKNDTITIGNDLEINKTITVDKAVTITANANVTITVGSSQTTFALSNGATLKGLHIVNKDATEKTNANIVTVGNDSKVINCVFEGTYTQGSEQVLRAMATVAGATKFVIENNEIRNLRQPGYIEGNGQIIGNTVENTRGWVVCSNYEPTIENNTFKDNAVDIAIIANKGASSVFDNSIAELSAQNNGAYVEHQVDEASAKDGVFYVDETQQNGYATMSGALKNAEDGDTIKLESDVEVTSTGSKNNYPGIDIKKAITLDGNGKTIGPANNFGEENSLIGITSVKGDETTPVIIKNLTLDGENITNVKHALNVYESTGVVIENVTAKNLKGYGLVVNSSEATVKSMDVSGCTWGAVNVDTKTDEDSKLVIENGTFSSSPDKASVWVEHSPKSDGSTSTGTSSVEINGGTFQNSVGSNTGDAAFSITGGDYQKETYIKGTSVNVTGGTFAEKFTVEADSLAINGGTFEKDVTNKNGTGTNVITGGNFKGSTPEDSMPEYMTKDENGNLVVKPGNGYLKQAIDNAKDGDTLRLTTGEYTLDDNVYMILDKKLTISGEGSETIIKGSSSVDYGNGLFTFTAGSEGSVLENMTIKYTATGAQTSAVYFNGNFAGTEANPTTIRNVDFQGSDSLETIGKEMAITSTYLPNDKGSLHISDCSFKNFAYAMYFNNISDLTVEDCVIDGTKYNAINIAADSDSYASKDITLTGNTLTNISYANYEDDAYSSGIRLGENISDDPVVTDNNITMLNNKKPILVEESTPGTAKYVVLYKDGNTVIGQEIVEDGNSITLPNAPASSRTFRGWYNSEDGKTYQPKEDVNITKDTTFTAQWKSSGGSSHRYDGYITIINPKNGEVSVSDDWAYEDDKITLTITPDDGYEVDKIEIVDDEGDKIDAKKVDDEDNKYTFRMANCDVTVTVTFKEEGKTTEDTDKEEDKDDEETTELNFTDVKETDWFFKGVEYVVDKSVMSGVSENEFAPSGKLTRAMLVQMLYNMESRPACDAENAFIDVPVGQWYTDAVIWANDAKIVSGMGEGLFAPNMEITREQMVAMLYNYAKYRGYDVTASADLSAFADTASVSAWAQPAMQWAVAEGYISGMGDSQLAPQGTATRAEIASVIMRFMEATAESAETAE